MTVDPGDVVPLSRHLHRVVTHAVSTFLGVSRGRAAIHDVGSLLWLTIVEGRQPVDNAAGKDISSGTAAGHTSIAVSHDIAPMGYKARGNATRRSSRELNG